MKKIGLFLILFSTALQAQQNAQDHILVDKLSAKSHYLKFLLNADSTNECHLLGCSYQYLYTSSYTTFRTGGCHLTFGLNLARFFTRKMIFGICADVKGFKGLTSQYFSGTFVNDFNNSFNTAYSSQGDSVRANVVRQAINGHPCNFGGNYFDNLGLMLSFFPQRFGGVMFMVKRVYAGFPVFGAGLDPYTNKDDHPVFSLDNNYSMEVSLKPYALFKSSRVNTRELKWRDLLKCLTLSFYYEMMNLKDGDFYGLKFSRMVSPSFLQKYGQTDNYGFKIGFALF